MKREIKFKAKRVDNGEWVFGSLVTGFWTKSKDGTEVVEIIESKDFAGDCWEDIMDDYVFEVHPKTVCQSIPNELDLELFDGDQILFNYNDGDGLEPLGYVQFNEELLCWCIGNGDHNLSDFVNGSIDKDDVKVGCNIHDK